MEEDQEKRMEFINTNIMEAGIDLEEITKFAEDQGKTFDSLNVDELKTLVEQFNNKDKQSQEKKEEPKKEETKIVEEKKEEPKKEEKKEEPKKEEKKMKQLLLDKCEECKFMVIDIPKNTLRYKP